MIVRRRLWGIAREVGLILRGRREVRMEKLERFLAQPIALEVHDLRVIFINMSEAKGFGISTLKFYQNPKMLFVTNFRDI